MADHREAAPAATPLPILLVIDDLPGIGASIRVMLARRYEVVSVTQPGEALELLRGPTPFCAILCDVQLASMSLEQLDAELRRTREELAEKLLLMTGGTFPDEELGRLQVPLRRRLLKPFSTEQLLRALATVGALPAPQP